MFYLLLVQAAKVEHPPTHQPPYAPLFPIQNHQNRINLLINKNTYNDMHFFNIKYNLKYNNN